LIYIYVRIYFRRKKEKKNKKVKKLREVFMHIFYVLF